LDVAGRRLLWRCRRGMKELDVLLERYARARLAQATREERSVLERFLSLPDPELADYLLGSGVPVEPDLARLAGLIRSGRG